MLLTEYNEEKVMEKEREEGRQEGVKNAASLTNWLWMNGRGEDAQKAATDSALFSRLWAEYMAVNTNS